VSGLEQAQVDKLLAPIKPRRVMKAQGQSHVAAFDVIAHLTRIFGFGGWDDEILSLDLVHERIVEQPVDEKTKKQAPPRCWVTYRCLMRLTIKDREGNVVARFEDAATGSSQNMPGVGDAHDFAVKNAISYAIKRCAKNLGDQFGLSLYNKGRTEALVGVTLVMPSGSKTEGDVEDHAPEPLSMGNDERQDPDQLTIEDAAEVPEKVTDGTWQTILDARLGLDDDRLAEWKTWIKSKGWTFTKSALSEAQALEVLAWVERRS